MHCLRRLKESEASKASKISFPFTPTHSHVSYPIYHPHTQTHIPHWFWGGRGGFPPVCNRVVPCTLPLAAVPLPLGLVGLLPCPGPTRLPLRLRAAGIPPVGGGVTEGEEGRGSVGPAPAEG
eukprot:comp20891_c1_seq1/m.27770 comp20891_c1_seq1/g.27770  ORF comp20891_c1_seq1/g.27770 comp20891_c1_seq1/m.27770 type:complete len:122 (+) comp20891_c1_seq1:272-637(+)